MTAWQRLAALSSLLTGTAWQRLTNPKTTGTGLVVNDGISISLNAQPTAVNMPVTHLSVLIDEAPVVVVALDTPVAVVVRPPSTFISQATP